MSKPHRGKGIRDLANRGRGTCPVCSRENIKALYEQEVGEGDAKKKIKVCKTCKAALKHGKKTVPLS
jgi:RNA polymerase subunit RPABC4/transcription elongation factor Spt4